MAVAVRSGTNTREYRLFLSNIATISSGIQNQLTLFSNLALARRLIGQNNADEAQNPHNRSYDRASALVQVLLTRIQLDSTVFYVVLEILWNIPNLQILATTIDPSYKGPPGRNTRILCGAGDPVEYSKPTILATTIDKGPPGSARNTSSITSSARSRPLRPGPGAVPSWEREWELAHLQLIKYVDPRTGCNKQIKIAVELAPSWREIATLLGLSNAEISAIESAGAGKTVHTCLTEVFGRWQSNSVNLKYPDTWKGVYGLLNDSSHGNLARLLKVALDAETSNIIGNYPEDLQTHAPATSNGSPHSRHDPTHEANGTSGASPIPQTTTGTKSRKKMNDDEVANWLEGEGVNTKDIQILKKHGVNERLFLDLSQDSPELKDVSEATKRQLSGLQKDIKADS